MIFNTFTTVSTNIAVFWDVTPDSLVTFNPLLGAPHNNVDTFKSYDIRKSIKKKSKNIKTNDTKCSKFAIRKKSSFSLPCVISV